LRTTSEIAKQNIVKQMLYNAYAYGMIDTVIVDEPVDHNTGAAFIATVNYTIDDVMTEANSRYMIYNNQVPTPSPLAIGIGTQIPYVITFNQYTRYVEVFNTIELTFGKYMAETGNENYDMSRRFINLNLLDFPTSIPTQPRSTVTGANVPATDINFFEMPTTPAGVALYPNTPQNGATKPLAFIVEPDAIIMRNQLDITTNFQNAATLATTNRLILRMTVSLSGFDKIACIAAATTTTP
jgi:hypothetical protein